MDVLNFRDAMNLSRILQAAVSDLRVRRWIDGFLFIGTAEALRTESGGYWPVDADIRDAFLSVQLPIGTALWPVRDLLREADVDNWTNGYAFIVDEASHV